MADIPPHQPKDNDQFMIAILPSKQYLESVALQEVVARMLRENESGGPVSREAQQMVHAFDPISPDSLKQKHDVDAYALMGVFGTLVRTHFVVKNSVSQTNPPPSDYLCDSCHTKGWLKQEFQESKLDGANKRRLEELQESSHLGRLTRVFGANHSLESKGRVIMDYLQVIRVKTAAGVPLRGFGTAGREADPRFE